MKINYLKEKECLEMLNEAFDLSVFILCVDGKPTIDNNFRNRIDKYENISNKFNEAIKSFSMSKKIPSVNIVDNNPFYLLQCKKFSYNTVKYSNIKDALISLIKLLECKEIPYKYIYIYKNSFMDKGIVWEEVEKNINKALRSKDNLLVYIVE